jgi:hypothetical protein
VPESQRDVHEKVANQSNLELPSLSPTRSLGPPHIQIDVQIAYDIHFGHSIYAWKDKEVTFPMTPVSCFGAAPPFWPDGPCIQLESITDVS